MDKELEIIWKQYMIESYLSDDFTKIDKDNHETHN